MKWHFKTVEGKDIEDISAYVKDYIYNDNLTSKFKIFIGCDSLPSSFGTATYVTVVCIYRIGRGAHIVFHRERKVKVYGKTKTERLKNRLWLEVYKAADLATELFGSGVFESSKIDGVEIHLDVNPNKKWESNLIYNEAIGYITSLGFDAQVKPDSPAASFASDHVCRGKESRKVDAH